MKKTIILVLFALFLMPCFADVRTKTYEYKTASVKLIWNYESLLENPEEVNWAESAYSLCINNGWASTLEYIIFLNPEKNSGHISYFHVLLSTAPSSDYYSYDYYSVEAFICKDGMQEKYASKSYYSFQFNEARRYFNDLKMPYEMLCELETRP